MRRRVSWSLKQSRMSEVRFFFPRNQNRLDVKNHLSAGVSLVPAGQFFGRGVGRGLVSRLVPAALTFGSGLGGSRAVDRLQVS